MAPGLDTAELLARIILALGVGMVIGLEREWREKAAGFRTLSLVSLGACVVTMLAFYVPGNEAARLAAGVITGIGFLGAGAILRDRGEVLGLTTAATVWVSAALGMAAAMGAYLLAVAGTALVLIVLLVFPVVNLSRLANDMRVYEVLTAHHVDYAYVAETLRSCGLEPHRQSVSRDDSGITSVWRAFGKPARHSQAIRLLLDDEQIASMSVT